MKTYICTGSGYAEDTDEDLEILTIVRAENNVDAFDKFNSWCIDNGIEPGVFSICESEKDFFLKLSKIYLSNIN